MKYIEIDKCPQEHFSLQMTVVIFSSIIKEKPLNKGFLTLYKQSKILFQDHEFCRYEQFF